MFNIYNIINPQKLIITILTKISKRIQTSCSLYNAPKTLQTFEKPKKRKKISSIKEKFIKNLILVN